MLRTVEAMVEPDGTVRILEPLQVEVTTRAIVTILAPLPENGAGNGAKILALLQSPRFANRPVSDPLEVAKRIEHLRNDWEQE